MSQLQRQKVTKIQNLPDVIETKIVEIGDIKSFERNGLLLIDFPGLGKFTLKANRVKYVDAQRYEYAGSFVENSGTGIITSLPEGKAGYFVVQGKSYTLFPVDAQTGVLVQFGENADAAGSCPVSGSVTQQQLDFCEEESNTCPASVHVLVLVTPEARNYFEQVIGDPFLAVVFANLGVSATNAGFNNSGIPNKQITYEFVSLFNFTLSSSIFTDINNMASSSNIQSLRAQYSADLVVMLTDDRYGSTYGIVNAIGPCFSCAYAIVAAPRMIMPRWTFAHEVAHLFGARHNRSSNGGNDNTDICSHGWRFFDNTSTERRTIMALLGTTGERILHFSNPNISFNGVATGTANDDNSKIIRNSGCTIADYFSSNFTSGETAIIDGPTEVSPEKVVVHSSYIDNSYAKEDNFNYDYEWRWSTSPLGEGFSFPDTNFSPNISLNDFPDLLKFKEIWLILKITSKTDGKVSTTRRRIDITKPEKEETEIYTPTFIFDKSQALDNNLLLYPNPAKNNLKVQLLHTDQQEFMLIHLTNANGAIIKKWELANDNSIEKLIDIDLSDLSSGIYFVNYISSQGTITKKLIVSK